MLLFQVIIVIIGSLKSSASQDTNELDLITSNNCSTIDNFDVPRNLTTELDLQENEESEDSIPDETLSDDTRDNTNVSHLKTLDLPKDWERIPKLKFPKTLQDDRYKMVSLHLDQGLFVFDFLRGFLSMVQPNDVPIGLLRDVFSDGLTVSKLVSQSANVEVGFLALVGICCLLATVIPATEIWLTCRPSHLDSEPSQHPGILSFLLGVCVSVLGSGMLTMMACNETAGAAVEKIPATMQTALEDLGHYHTGTTTQLRLTLTRSLDVASEAVLADLDNVEELLGKPVQEELSAQTGLDVALDALLDVGNATTELSSRAETLFKTTEKARTSGEEVGREAGELRRQLETAARGCPPPDRALCATLDPSGLHLAIRLDRLLKDERLLRLRGTGRENLTESGRQARGEYLYVPHHVARTTLDARNEIRREISNARNRVTEEARGLDTSSTELSKHLETARRVINEVVPHLATFEQTRWLIGIGTVLAVFIVWMLLLSALCCRCGATEDKVRPTLLSAVILSCIVSVGLWAVILADLTLTTHTEMLLCRPLHDPEYRTVEALLETRGFLEKPLGVPLKELLSRCEQNQAAYPVYHLGGSTTLEHLTAHWTWPGLAKAMHKLKVDLKGLRILTPNLQVRLQNLLYASGSNLTEHRTRIQGPVLNKDLSALSEQLDNVARQIRDHSTARNLDAIAATARSLLDRKVRPLMKMHEDLVYQLTSLELQLQPLQRQVNQSISHLKTIQFYIDNQGEKIAQMKTKAYVDRIGSYLDQWRVHVLAEMGTGVARCRPLWDVIDGVRLLLCHHVLGPLNGFWFATVLCALVLMASTPLAHLLASVHKPEDMKKETVLLPSRMESPDTITMDRETWRTPETPPSDGW
ncbi:prominin-1-A isoform X1 [Neodiprion fabricii]|uniref:prominin-1-A isoform X1 n=1 Tax=Neodiprion fabricii TaxID=2872261 RepID=UPI001ED8C99A|nr:prominin-1-A isoform X1 [Neodiprion fabricii]